MARIASVAPGTASLDGTGVTAGLHPRQGRQSARVAPLEWPRFGADAIRGGLGPAARGHDRSTPRLSDEDLRLALLEALELDGVRVPPYEGAAAGACVATTNTDTAVAVEELPLRGGYVRADVAIVRPTSLHVYEIKSDRDRLDRLPEQRRLYGEIADYVTLVVGWRHVLPAMRTVPHWWEVWLAEADVSGRPSFVPLRAGVRNPDVHIAALASLLSRDEAISFLTDSGAATGTRSLPRAALYSRIAEALQGEQPVPGASTGLVRLRQRVHAYWCRRASAPAPLWSSYGG